MNVRMSDMRRLPPVWLHITEETGSLVGGSAESRLSDNNSTTADVTDVLTHSFFQGDALRF